MTLTTCPSGDPAPLSILVVDDFRDGADSLAEFLRLGGHGVRIAYDAPAALAAERPDVVILELLLRGSGGWELVRKMRERFADRQPGYVAVTTCGFARDRRRSKEAGIDPHLLKPVEPGVLIAVLQRFAEASTAV